MTSEYGYKDFKASPVRPLKDSLGPATAHSKNRGLAAMPAQERSMGIDGRALGGEPTRNQRQHREAMARNSSPQGPAGASQAGGSKAGPSPGSRQESRQGPPQQSRPHAHSRQQQRWDDGEWDDQHEAAGHRAPKLLSGSSSRIHRIGDQVGALRRWMVGERWVKRLAVAAAALAAIFTICFGGLWWRLGAGPINLDIATPWLA